LAISIETASTSYGKCFESNWAAYSAGRLIRWMAALRSSVLAMPGDPQKWCQRSPRAAARTPSPLRWISAFGGG